MMSVSMELQVAQNLQCESSESEMELERFKRLVYTLHPKATSLRMHSMRKRRVTTKFTMVKKSNKTAGASWYYKIHPTHRRNTTQILIFLFVRPAYISICISLRRFLINLFIRSLPSSSFLVRVEHCYWIERYSFFHSR